MSRDKACRWLQVGARASWSLNDALIVIQDAREPWNMNITFHFSSDLSLSLLPGEKPHRRKLISPPSSRSQKKKSCRCYLHVHGAVAASLTCCRRHLKKEACESGLSLFLELLTCVCTKTKKSTCCCCSAFLFIFLLKMDVVLGWTGWEGKSAWNSGRQLTVSECQMKSFSFLSRGGEVCHQHSWLWLCQRGWRRETDWVLFYLAEGKSTVLEGSSVAAAPGETPPTCPAI